MTDLNTFRHETRAWLEANCPPEMRRPMRGEDDNCWGGRNWKFQSEAQKVWLERMAAKGWTVPTWPKAYGGGGLSREEDKILRGGDAQPQGALPLQSFGIWMLGPALLKFGTRGAEAGLPAADRARRNPLVPGLFGAERRLRPRLAADQVRGQRRPLPRQRPEDLDQLRRQGRLDLLPRAHRPDGDEARRHHLPAVRHGIARRHDRADPLISGKSPFCETFFDNVKVPKAQPRRHAQSRLGHRQVSADARARDDRRHR